MFKVVIMILVGSGTMRFQEPDPDDHIWLYKYAPNPSKCLWYQVHPIWLWLLWCRSLRWVFHPSHKKSKEQHSTTHKPYTHKKRDNQQSAWWALYLHSSDSVYPDNRDTTSFSWMRCPYREELPLSVFRSERPSDNLYAWRISCKDQVLWSYVATIWGRTRRSKPESAISVTGSSWLFMGKCSHPLLGLLAFGTFSTWTDR